MEDETPNFGLARKKNPFEEYIGNYVFIRSHSGKDFGGKLIEIDNFLGVLNPYLGMNVDKENGFVAKMIEKNSKFNLNCIEKIEYSTKEDWDNYCAFCNKDSNSKK